MKQPPAFKVGEPSYLIVASTPGSVRPTRLTASKEAVDVGFLRTDFIRAQCRSHSIGPHALRFKLASSPGVVDDDLDAPVLLTAVGGVVARDGVGFSEATCADDTITSHAGADDVITHCRGACVRQAIVQFVGTARIGVAFELEGVRTGVREEHAA